MDHKTYSKAYNQSKAVMRQRMDEAIKRFKEQSPERFIELQAQALHELEHPPERSIIRHAIPCATFNVDEFVRQHHTRSFYIHTTDSFGSTHLYFESLDDETAVDVLKRRHSKFTERNEEVTKVEKCICPLCQNLN